MSDQRNELLKLVLMGTGPFAVPSFERLRADGHEILLVVTRPIPKVKSRGGPPPAPVREWAEQHGLEIYAPDSINSEDAVERVAGCQADLLVVCDYGQILKPPALEAAKMGGINLHGSLLPAYRGAAPVQRALLSGDSVTGVSVIHMTPRLDGGPVLTTRSTEIRDDEDSGQLEKRLSEIGVDATADAVEQLIRWDGVSTIGEVQDKEKISKAPRLSKAEAEIDWSRSSRWIDCLVRGMQPWPIAYSHLAIRPGKPSVRLQIKQVRIVDLSEAGDNDWSGFAPGTILAGSGLYVATGDGVVEVLRLQPAGRKETTGTDFVRGHRLEAGSVMG